MSSTVLYWCFGISGVLHVLSLFFIYLLWLGDDDITARVRTHDKMFRNLIKIFNLEFKQCECGNSQYLLVKKEEEESNG